MATSENNTIPKDADPAIERSMGCSDCESADIPCNCCEWCEMFPCECDDDTCEDSDCECQEVN